MKMATIKKALIKQSIMALVIVGAAGGGLFGVYMLDQEYIKKVRDLKSQTDGIVQAVGALNKEFMQFKQNLDVYHDIEEKRANNMLTVDQAALKEVFAEASKRHHFENFKANVSTPTPREGKKLQTMMVNASDVNITMDALSDEELYGMMQEVQNAFSGIAFTSLSMEASQLDNVALQRVLQEGFAPLVKGELKFVWSGLQEVKENASTESLIDDKGGAK